MKSRFALTTSAAFQAAIAIILCFLIGNYFHLEKSYWAVLTALLLISQTWGESLKKAFERIGMTILGGLVGTIIFIEIQGQLYLQFPIMMLTVFFIVFSLGYSFKSSAFFVTIFIAFLFGMIGQWNFHLLEIRIYETILGATIAVLTSIIFLPSHAKSSFKSQATDYLLQCRDIMNTSFNIALQTEDKLVVVDLRDQLFKSLNQLNATYSTSRYEMLFTVMSRKNAKQLLNYYLVLIHYVTSLLEAAPYFHYDVLSNESKEQLINIQKLLLHNTSVIINKFEQKNTEEKVQPLKDKLDDLTHSCLQMLKTNKDINNCAMHMVSFIYYVRKINEVLVDLEKL